MSAELDVPCLYSAFPASKCKAEACEGDCDVSYSSVIAALDRRAGIDVDALIAELSESSLPGARYAVAVVKEHVARLSSSVVTVNDDGTADVAEAS